MAREQPTGAGVALDDVEAARRKTCLRVDFRQPECTDRSQFRRLEDHGVAAGERRRGLPARELDRVVPRPDSNADAERLTSRVGEGLAEIDMLPRQARGEAGVILDAIGAAEHVNGDRLLDRLAGVEHLKLGEFAIALAQDGGGAVQDAAPFGAGHARPDAESFLSGRDRPLDVFIPGLLNGADRLARRRVQRLEGLARQGVHEPSADMELLLGKTHRHLSILKAPSQRADRAH
jgi:hypothetical protein